MQPLKYYYRTCLVGQWVRIHLPEQGTQVLSLIWGRFHMLRSNQAHELQLLRPVLSGAHEPHLPSLRAVAAEAYAPRAEPVLSNKRSRHSEKPMHCMKSSACLWNLAFGASVTKEASTPCPWEPGGGLQSFWHWVGQYDQVPTTGHIYK